MKTTKLLLKSINNIRDGYHLASRYWQDYKHSLPALPQYQVEVAVGMILGDAGMFRVSKEAGIKFEQGYAQEAFLRHLFDLFSKYCFMLAPGERMTTFGPRKGLIKSFWFKTFSHHSFTTLWNIFYHDGVKVIMPGLVLDHVTPVALAYWIMCDGSLDGNTMILHTQGFTKEGNTILSNELNQKFGLHSEVIVHKHIYTVIRIPYIDAGTLRGLIKPHIIPSMEYKLPK